MTMGKNQNLTKSTGKKLPKMEIFTKLGQVTVGKIFCNAQNSHGPKTPTMHNYFKVGNLT
jgi:hypothetical protein